MHRVSRMEERDRPLEPVDTLRGTPLRLLSFAEARMEPLSIFRRVSAHGLAMHWT